MCIYIYTLYIYIINIATTHIHNMITNNIKQTQRSLLASPLPPRHHPLHVGLQLRFTPSLRTKITPTKIARLNISGKFPMGLGIPTLTIKILLESNPLKSRILVRRLAVASWPTAQPTQPRRDAREASKRI